MKRFLFAACIIPAFAGLRQSVSAATDSTVRKAPLISYHKLDSLIGTNEYTALYFWPTWCAPCFTHVPEIIDALKGKHRISLYLINEATSQEYVSRKLVPLTSTVKGYWRMPRMGKTRMIEINNHFEMKYFQEHYLREKISKANLRNPVFVLLDRQGQVLFVSSLLGFDMADVIAALAGYD